MKVQIIIKKTKYEELEQYLNSYQACDFNQTEKMMVFAEPDCFHKCFRYLLSEKLEYMIIQLLDYDQCLFQNISFEEIDYMYRNNIRKEYEFSYGLLCSNNKFVWNLFIQNSVPTKDLLNILGTFICADNSHYDQFYSLLNLINKRFKYIDATRFNIFLAKDLIHNNNLLMLNLWCVFLRKYQLKILYADNNLFMLIIYTIFYNKLDYARILMKLHQSLKGTFDDIGESHTTYFTTHDKRIITEPESIEYLCRKMKDKTIVMPDDFIQAYSIVLNKYHKSKRARDILKVLRRNFPDGKKKME